MSLALVSIGQQHGKVLHIGDEVRCSLSRVEYIDSVHYLSLSLLISVMVGTVARSWRVESVDHGQGVQRTTSRHVSMWAHL